MANSKNSCDTDPNFAEICSFIEVFGQMIGIGNIRFEYLQRMIETRRKRRGVPETLVRFHIQLLRNYFPNCIISSLTWERWLIKFADNIGKYRESLEIKKSGYRLLRTKIKLRIFKKLLIAQFDCNKRFRIKLRGKSAKKIRQLPLGQDQDGHIYWCQIDCAMTIRVQRENVENATWETVITERKDLDDLVAELKKDWI